MVSGGLRMAFVAAFMLLPAVLVRAEEASAPKAGDVAIVRAEQPVAVDGVLDEPCWAQAKPIRADYINSKQGVLSAEPRLLARFAYDDEYLYIAYETFDRNLVALGTSEFQGPPDNRRQGAVIWKEGVKVDVVEFFISFGDEHFFWEIHHNAANHFNDVWCTVVDPAWPIAKSSMVPFGILFGDEMFIRDEGEHKLARAVRLKPKADGKPSTVNDPTDLDTGYTAEIRLPWAGLGAPLERRTWLERDAPEPGKPKVREPGPWKMAGQVVHVIAAVQDGDLAERYHHSSPTRNGGWFHKSFPDWPRYRLAP